MIPLVQVCSRPAGLLMTMIGSPMRKSPLLPSCTGCSGRPASTFNRARSYCRANPINSAG